MSIKAAFILLQASMYSVWPLWVAGVAAAAGAQTARFSQRWQSLVGIVIYSDSGEATAGDDLVPK